MTNGQSDLWGQRAHPTKPGIDLRCCDVAEILAECRGARLVMADPPWLYRNGGNGRACGHYELITMGQIVGHVDASFDCAEDDTYLLLWATFPTLFEWFEASKGIRWEYISGGAWTKPGGPGTGHHWRGNAEAMLLYRKGEPHPRKLIKNAIHLPRQAHSEKPAEWLSQHVEAFTEPVYLVLDVYSGLAPMARACLATGRRYIGAEIDPERHQKAMAKLWAVTP